MFPKKLLTFLFLTLFFLSNCAAPSSVSLLGPIFTASKTGSIYQASLSYSSSEIVNKIKKDFEKERNKLKNKSRNFINRITQTQIKPPMPIVLITETVEISEVPEIEHLP